MLVYFAANPEEVLTTRDMMDKFDISGPKEVAAKMRRLISDGWLAKSQEADTNKWRMGLPLNVYHAGPRILELHRVADYEE